LTLPLTGQQRSAVGLALQVAEKDQPHRRQQQRQQRQQQQQKQRAQQAQAQRTVAAPRPGNWRGSAPPWGR
jgi:hypothetical protein